MLDILRGVFYVVAIITMILFSCFIWSMAPADRFLDARIHYLLYEK